MPPAPRRLTAHELIDTVVDAGTWRSWDLPPLAVAEPGSPYAADLAKAAEASGADESVITGEALIHGRRVAAVVSEFGFLAGSIGRAAAERIVLAFERARRERLPMLAAPASGGTRMQEGTPAFVGMVKIAVAVAQFKDAGLPYLVYLRHPTTGGVFASWGSLGHMTAAEPGATIGFLGARVYEALHHEPFPSGVQTAENLYDHGVVDAVFPVEQLPAFTAQALAVLTARAQDVPPVDPTTAELTRPPQPAKPAWDSVLASRRENRPTVRAILDAGATDVLPLRGTGHGEDDRRMLLALARFGDTPCIVIGQDRLGNAQPLGPGGLRVARRGMHLAGALGLPLLTVIDTEGAALSRAAEEGGLAAEIARSLTDLVTLRSPTLCVLLGQGTGGAALAILPADRVVAAEHAWVSPLAPEGASAIVYRVPDRAPELAEAQRVRAVDLLADGIVDRVVPEPVDAADDPESCSKRVAAVVHEELDALWRTDPDRRQATRFERYRHLGL